MSLVDYASSSEDEEVEEDEDPQHYRQDTSGDEQLVEKERPDESAAAATVLPQFPQSQQKSFSPHSTYQHPDVIPSNAPSMEKLPDASILLSSPSFSPQQYSGIGNSSRIASTTTEMASKKREPNGSAFIHPPNKQPRGHLPHSRNIPDTVSGSLIPPQLKGRSNVVTEDLRKLFVNRHKEPSG